MTLRLYQPKCPFSSAQEPQIVRRLRDSNDHLFFAQVEGLWTGSYPSQRNFRSCYVWPSDAFEEKTTERKRITDVKNILTFAQS